MSASFLQPLVERWRAAFGQYAALKQAAEAAVARTEWTSGSRYSHEPLYFRRYPGRGRILASQPPYGGNLYGFDDQGRVRFERLYCDADSYFEVFYTYAPDLIEGIRFTAFQPRLPIQVTRYHLEEGRVILLEEFGVSIGPEIRAFTPDGVYDLTARYNGQWRDRQAYVYEGDPLVSIRREMEGRGLPRTTSQETMLYDAGGRLEQIVVASPGQPPRTTYRRPRRGQTLARLGAGWRRRLPGLIQDALRQAAIQEPVYCLALSYREGDSAIPPLLFVGRESYRQALLRQPTAEARFYLYPPLDTTAIVTVEIDDPALQEAGQVFEQLVMAAEKWEAAEQLLHDVAASLAGAGWQGIMPLTEDFIVFAADFELGEIEAAIAASNPPERVADLKRRGLL